MKTILFQEYVDYEPEAGIFYIRFPDFTELQSGKGNFKIVEINGAGGEATSIWDSSTTLAHAYGTLMRQWAMLFKIGALNEPVPGI